MTAFTAMMEQVTRFDDITWPQLMAHLGREDPTHTKARARRARNDVTMHKFTTCQVGEADMPPEYQCDDVAAWLKSGWPAACRVVKSVSELEIASEGGGESGSKRSQGVSAADGVTPCTRVFDRNDLGDVCRFSTSCS